jgi:hypothetical protein
MSSTISFIDNDVLHLLNAPKCAFKVPTAVPPLLNLNEQQQQQQQQGNTHMLFKVRNKNTFTMLISNDDSLISTSSESDNDEHTPISILSILEKLV